MLNAVTIDVEDWRELVRWKLTGNRPAPDVLVIEETQRALELMSDANIRGTFFILASVALKFPTLIRQIDGAGHEVACHGWSHRLVYQQSPDDFRAETLRAKELLEDVIGKAVVGYRAAEFSITQASYWALEILTETGFAYDSSVFPVKSRRYGVGDAPLAPHVVQTSAGNITEFPLSAIETLGTRWGIAGGGYLRLWPYFLTKAGVDRVNGAGRPAVIYLHPYEFSLKPLKVPMSEVPVRSYLRAARYLLAHNILKNQLQARFIRLAQEYQFARLCDLNRALTGSKHQ